MAELKSYNEQVQGILNIIFVLLLMINTQRNATDYSKQCTHIVLRRKHSNTNRTELEYIGHSILQER